MKKIKNSRNQRYVIGGFFYAFIVMGAFYSLIGSALPMMKEEYQLDYQISGIMMSVLSLGYLISGLCIGMIIRFLGNKRTYLIFGSVLIAGLVLVMISPNPIVLLCAVAMIGVSRGCIDTIGNRAVSVASCGNAVPINLLQACYSAGTCIAPLIAMICGASWRTAFVVLIGLSLISVLLGTQMEIDQQLPQNEEKKNMSLAFFKSRHFWLCVIFLVCYLSIEDTLIGWLVTYFLDSGLASQSIAQMLASVFWATILAGRLVSALLSNYFTSSRLLMVMSVGAVVGFTLLVFSHSLIWMIVGLIVLGSFMAGIYGTSLANGRDLIGQYQMCMGMFIAFPGIGAAIMPGVVGILADRIGIHKGIRILYFVIALLMVNAILNLQEKKNTGGDLK